MSVRSGTDSLRAIMAEYTAERDKISANGDYTAEARQRKLSVLDAGVRERAVKASETLLADMRAEQAQRRALLAEWATAEAAKWDYGRLQVARDILQARLVAVHADESGIRAMYEADKAAGDAYTLRAWTLAAPQLAEREGQELRFLAHELSRELSRQTDAELNNAERVTRGDAANVEAHDAMWAAHRAIGGAEGTVLGLAGPLAPQLAQMRKKSRTGMDYDTGQLGLAQWVELAPVGEPARTEGDGEAKQVAGVGVFG